MGGLRERGGGKEIPRVEEGGGFEGKQGGGGKRRRGGVCIFILLSFFKHMCTLYKLTVNYNRCVISVPFPNTLSYIRLILVFF